MEGVAARVPVKSGVDSVEPKEEEPRQPEESEGQRISTIGPDNRPRSKDAGLANTTARPASVAAGGAPQAGKPTTTRSSRSRVAVRGTPLEMSSREVLTECSDE